MRLDILTDDPDGPVTRHRYLAVAPALRAAGFEEVRVVPVPHGLGRRASAFRGLRGASLVLLSRRLFMRVEFSLLRGAAPRLAYDFDDALCFRDSSRGRPKSLVRRRRFARTVRGADVVTAGNAYLADLARQCGAASPVLAPTPVDTDRLTPGSPPAGPFRAGWIGSRSTRPYLAMLAAPLREVAARVPGFSFSVMADRPPDPARDGLDGVPLSFVPWSEAAEAPFLRSLHCGVMPLPDDPWTRGKCGFKLLQYMACGVPFVASPVGVNVDLAADGGRLAGDDAAWRDALLDVALDPIAARERGARGRAAAESRWSARVLGPAFASTLARAAAT